MAGKISPYLANDHTRLEELLERATSHPKKASLSGPADSELDFLNKSRGGEDYVDRSTVH